MITTKNAISVRLSELLLAVALACHAVSASAQDEGVRPLPQETPEQAQRMADSLFRSKFAIDDADPVAGVPAPAERNASPLDFGVYLMELGERADRAEQRGDHLRAARYYSAIAKAVPDEPLGFVRACAAYEAAGQRLEALTACADALARKGATVADFERYVRLVLAERNTLSEKRIADLDALMAHLRTQLPNSVVPAQLRCDIGVRLLDRTRLRECTAALRKRGAVDEKTLGYEWVLAVQEQDYTAAAKVVERARHSRMRPEAVEVMARTTESLASPWQRLFDRSREITALALVALGVLLQFVFARRLRMRPKRIGESQHASI